MRKAEQIRVITHRLRPSLRLKTQGQIHAFIHDEMLVSFLGGNELPSLISAILGRQWKPSQKGFTGWLDWWSVKISGQPIPQISRELEARKDILATRVFRGTKTLVSNRIWPMLDPIVSHHKELVQKGELLSDLEHRLLNTIEAEGSIRTDRLRKRLKLEARGNNSKFHRALTNLESYSLIVGFEDPHPEKHLHANIWQTWDTRTRTKKGRVGLSFDEALANLLEKTIDACVFARDDQIEKWFRWKTHVNSARDELLDTEAILRAGPYLVSSRILDLNN